MTGRIIAGQPIRYPTKTVAVSSVLPDFDQYKGLPIEYGRMEATISDPTVVQQYGMRVAFTDAHQLNALETINLRGERSVTCKGKFDTAPSAGPLPKNAPAVCEKFRQQPDALEVAAAWTSSTARSPTSKSSRCTASVMSIKNWYDAKDMRSTGGNDVNFALDASNADSPDVADMRTKGAIIYAVSTAASTGLSSIRGPAKSKTYVPNGNFQGRGLGRPGLQPLRHIARPARHEQRLRRVGVREPRDLRDLRADLCLVQRPCLAQRCRQPARHEGRDDGWRPGLLRLRRPRGRALPLGGGCRESARHREGLQL